MIVSIDNPRYTEILGMLGGSRYNGAFYYAGEIERNIIPNVRTDRNWMLVNVEGEGFDHSVVFVHNNLHPEIYRWLGRLNDLVLVCGIESTYARMGEYGVPVHIPISVDVPYVESFRREKDRDTAYVGRASKRMGEGASIVFPASVTLLENMPRERLLAEMARYERVYAVGRCALEAKVLGCEVLPYDPRYPDPSVWKVLDNRDAAAMLQDALDGVDGCRDTVSSSR